MATPVQVLEMLCPDVEWAITGEDFENIHWFGKEAPITKKQYLDGFQEFDNFRESQKQSAAIAKAALLEKLGITEEEAKLLLS